MIDRIKRFLCNPESGIVTGLETASNNVSITSGGIEIGNWFGFCSQQNLGGVNCQIDGLSVQAESDWVESHFNVSLPESSFAVSILEQLCDGVWVREASATALKPSWLGDFVLRLGVNSDRFPVAGAGTRQSLHKARNTYHQHPVTEVFLESPQRTLTTQMQPQGYGGRLSRVSYWRDQPDGQWIQHHRLLVDQSDMDQVVFRCRHKVSDSRNTHWLRNRLLWSPFWALNESVLSHLPFRLPTIQTQGIVQMDRGETVSLNSRVTLTLNNCDAT